MLTCRVVLHRACCPCCGGVTLAAATESPARLGRGKLQVRLSVELARFSFVSTAPDRGRRDSCRSSAAKLRKSPSLDPGRPSTLLLLPAINPGTVARRRTKKQIQGHSALSPHCSCSSICPAACPSRLTVGFWLEVINILQQYTYRQKGCRCICRILPPRPTIPDPV
jgi:hypothetical protein